MQTIKRLHDRRVSRAGIATFALLIVAAVLFWSNSRLQVQTFATGLDQPRGMAFDPDGNLYVAEAGVADAVADPMISPSTNQSSRVQRIDPGGAITTLVDGLPSTHYEVEGDVGATDIAVLGDTIYVLTGEGYDDDLSRSVLRLPAGGPPQRVANLLTFAFGSTPAAEQMASGAVPSNPFAMVAAPDQQSLLITDGASGSVLRVALDGTTHRFAVLPNIPPLTGLAFDPAGRLHVAMLSSIPLARGGGAIWVAAPDGELALAADELTLPIDIAFDTTGQMYVLEFGDIRQPAQPYTSGTGRLLRVAPDGARKVVLDRLNYPTAMLFSRTGDLYITVNGAFSAAGQGTILKMPCRMLGNAAACPGG